jgi:hypothetical protein
VADLISTIDHNLGETQKSRFQLKVSYDNLPGEPLAKFRALSTRESRKLLEILDRELSAADRDVNAASTGAGRFRAGVSIYYFEEELSDEAEGAGSASAGSRRRKNPPSDQEEK